MQNKSWWDKRKSVAKDLKKEIRVGIRRVSWISGQNGDHGGVGGVRGGPGQNHPSPPGRTEKSKLGVREGGQVSTTTPPTRTDRESGVSESEFCEGDQVPPPSYVSPTWS